MKKYALIFVIAIVAASLVFALTEATVGSATERGRWTGTAAGSDSTEGGNITGLNVSSDMLTEKWAAYYGNVTGSIILTDSVGANNVYDWSWTPADGGEVCLTQDNAFPWASAEAAVRADVDTAFSFTAGDADSAANTYTDASCSLTINEVSGAITSTGTTLNSGFVNCVLGDGTEAAESDFAFCTSIDNGGSNWNSESANYEIMVPTSETAGATETYYFYVELN